MHPHHRLQGFPGKNDPHHPFPRLPRKVTGTVILVDLEMCLTSVNYLFILLYMISTFKDMETESFFTTGKSKRFPPDVLKRAVKRLTQIDAATVIEDLRFPPSNRLEALVGDRAKQWSIRINDQWRLCFRFESGEAYDVEIVDYH